MPADTDTAFRFGRDEDVEREDRLFANGRALQDVTELESSTKLASAGPTSLAGRRTRSGHCLWEVGERRAKAVELIELLNDATQMNLSQGGRRRSPIYGCALQSWIESLSAATSSR